MVPHVRSASLWYPVSAVLPCGTPCPQCFPVVPRVCSASLWYLVSAVLSCAVYQRPKSTQRMTRSAFNAKEPGAHDYQAYYALHAPASWALVRHIPFGPSPLRIRGPTRHGPGSLSGGTSGRSQWSRGPLLRRHHQAAVSHASSSLPSRPAAKPTIRSRGQRWLPNHWCRHSKKGRRGGGGWGGQKERAVPPLNHSQPVVVAQASPSAA